MTDPFAAAAAVIDAAFAETVTYTGGGLPAPTKITVVWSDMPGDAFQGPGNTTRTVSCEIRYGKLPQRPKKADRITRNGSDWKPNQVSDDDTVGAWNVVLERA